MKQKDKQSKVDVEKKNLRFNRSEYSGRADGTYTATVNYYNPNTGYSQSYDLDVEVSGGEVTTIYWPDGGWSDVSGEIDEDGNADAEGESGQEYEIEVDIESEE